MKQYLLILIFFLPFISYGNVDHYKEAENCDYSDGVIVQENENASGGQFLKIQKDETVTLEIPGIENAGTYQLQIFHFNGGVEQTFHLKINEDEFVEKKLNPSNWAYQEPALTTNLEVELTTGTNTIILKALAGNTILLDRFRYYEPYDQTAPRTFYFSAEGNDLNNGSENAPFKSLAKATEIAKNINEGGLVKEGDKILFRRGDRFEGHFEIKCSGTEELPIEIGSYGEGELPIISGSGNIEGGDYFEAVKTVNISYVNFRDLWIQNDRQNLERYNWGKDKSFGILVTANQWGNSPSSNLTFKGMKFTDVFGAGIPEEFNSLSVTGLRFESDSNNVDKEVTIRDILVEDCYFSNIGKAGVWSIHKGKNSEEDSVNRSINFVIRNNTFYKTGGSGVILSKVYNALVENNTFDHTGYSSEEEPRLAGRGSGMWVFSARNIIAQYNEALSVRGPNDSYGLHIDFGNKNIIYQYNYTEDCEGGFVEVLGDNHNVAYRFNVSVNDGFRDFHGSVLWTSGYVGNTVVNGVKVPNTPVKSDGVYIYNNTVYLNKAYNPDISLFSKNTYVYNNIFVHEGDGIIGEKVEMEMEGDFIVSNNLFYGNHNNEFSDLDINGYFKDPLFQNKGASTKEGYQITEASPVIGQGLSFPEPSFPNIGKGIFKNIPLNPNVDIYGNAMSIETILPNIGADNGFNSIQEPEVSIAFKEHLSEIFVGKNLTLEIIINPENTVISDLTFTSSNEQIASINPNGVVTAISEGNVTITAYSEKLDITATTQVSIKKDEVTLIDDQSISSIKVFPNPATSFLKIQTNSSSLKSIRLYSFIGQQYYVNTMHKTKEINLQKLPKGMYFIEISEQGKEVYTTKLIVR